MDLVRLYDSINNGLSLHFASHTADPPLAAILRSSSQLLRRPVLEDDVLLLLAVDHDVFKLSTVGGTVRISRAQVSREEFSRKVSLRAIEPAEAETHPASKTLDHYIKGDKPARGRRTPVIKNDSARFKYQPKSEVLRQRETGMSLLERIRAKERLRNQQRNDSDPEQRRRDRIRDKLKMVYEVLYQLGGGSYLVVKVRSIVQDSVPHGIGSEEVDEILHWLSTKVDCSVVAHGDVTVLKIGRLQRDSDLNKI